MDTELLGVGSASAAHPNRHAFRIALTMSGAISAGAYTAGVFDFLVQALAELEAARRREEQGTPVEGLPDHDVRLVALAGASAGGITAALGSVALGYGLGHRIQIDGPAATWPVDMPTRDGRETIPCVLPKLYDTWVVRPCMTAPAGQPSLLSTEDVQSTVASVLTWRVLDQIRDAALAGPVQLGVLPPHSFIAEPLHVYLTLSNVTGIPYSVSGAKNSAPYRMLGHADRLHFKVHGLGADEGVASGWEAADKGSYVTVQDLLVTNGPNGKAAEWQRLCQGALATAAFPGGLSARLLKGARDEYYGRLLPAPGFSCPLGPPDFSPSVVDPFGYINVDGGLIDNEPFEYSRFALLKDWSGNAPSNPRRAEEADRAVIMIAAGEVPYQNGPA